MYLGIRYSTRNPSRRILFMCPGQFWTYSREMRAAYYERIKWMKGVQREWNHKRRPLRRS